MDINGRLKSEKATLHQQIRSWYSTAKGRYVLEQIQYSVDQKLSEIFGFNAIDLGVLAATNGLLDNTRVKTQYSLAYCFDQNNDTLIRPALTEYDFLPVMFDNIDLLVASHVLELSERPHQVLREIDRVLLPEGHCILIGFNAYRYWRMSGLARQLKGENGQYHFYTPKQLKDWFSVLGFEILDVNTFGYRPHWSSSRVYNRMKSFEEWSSKHLSFYGSIYMIHAQKQEVGMLMKPKLKRRHRLSGGVVAPAPAASRKTHAGHRYQSDQGDLE